MAPSSPEDQLTKIFYPPDGASAIFEGASIHVVFQHKVSSYDKFDIVESDPSGSGWFTITS